MTATASALELALLAPDRATAPVILLATDGSAESVSARAAAVDVAGRLHAQLHIVHAWMPTVEQDDAGERSARRFLFREQLDAVNQRACVHATHLVAGDAPAVIIDTAAECHADLVVMGGRRLEGFDRWLLGSVSDPVARLAPCSVLVVHGGPRAWPPERVVVGPHAGEEERRAAAAVAALLGAQPALEGHRRRDDGDERSAAPTLTVLIRGRHRLMIDAMMAHHLRAACGPVLVLAPPPHRGAGLDRHDRWFLPVL